MECSHVLVSDLELILRFSSLFTPSSCLLLPPPPLLLLVSPFLLPSLSLLLASYLLLLPPPTPPSQDGRLRQEDQLLQINEESVIHMRYEDVVAKLRSVSQSGRSIRLVVARVVSGRVDEESGVLPEINDVRERL